MLHYIVIENLILCYHYGSINLVNLVNNYINFNFLDFTFILNGRFRSVRLMFRCIYKSSKVTKPPSLLFHVVKPAQ